MPYWSLKWPVTWRAAGIAVEECVIPQADHRGGPHHGTPPERRWHPMWATWQGSKSGKEKRAARMRKKAKADPSAPVIEG